MEQEKIGRFIAECRKSKGLTQMQLAEKLGITNRAVSKWENAKSMPDVSVMISLCEILDISVNELLSGEKISMDAYREKAEQNLMASCKINLNN
ncbi:MAG: helix-turn-helix transcriptional regulator [Eubacteriales bacterium]|nr:helix-turn-helix transcriptional regulator [Eubacteriales bacterium]